jgi:hypothetical protein
VLERNDTEVCKWIVSRQKSTNGVATWSGQIVFPILVVLIKLVNQVSFLLGIGLLKNLV